MSWGAFFTLVAVVFGVWFVVAVGAGMLVGRMIKRADDLNDDE